MKLHVGGEMELVSWILSFGSSARVVSPDRLRRLVETELSRTLETYTKEVTVAAAKKPRRVELKRAAVAVGRKAET